MLNLGSYGKAYLVEVDSDKSLAVTLNNYYMEITFFVLNRSTLKRVNQTYNERSSFA